MRQNFPFFRLRRLPGLLVWAGLLLALPAAAVSGDGQNYLMIEAPSAEQNSTKILKAQVQVDAPPAVAWEILTDYPEFSDFVPGYQKSQVLRSQGNQSTVDVALRVSPFLPVYRYQVLAQADHGNLTLSFQRIAGDFKSMQAQYRLLPKQGGRQTLIVYELRIDPGYHIPGSNMILKTHTEKSCRALEARIEDAYRKSIIGQR